MSEEALDWSAYAPETIAIRAGSERSAWGEHSEGLFLTSSYIFENAAQAAARFSGDSPGNVYARFTNPTVNMLETRLAALEGGERAVATASGMAAILALTMGILQAGDEIVASRSLFGATVQLLGGILGRFGVVTHFVDGTQPAAWAEAITSRTRLLFVETPSNPLTEVVDIAALARLAHENGARLAVDNSFCTPALQRPLQLGADFVIHSATKYLDGQGRVLAGAVVSQVASALEPVYAFLRTAGPSLSPFNAWVVLKGLETLALRMNQHAANALALAQWLSTQPQVEKVFYPGLSSHPQHDLAKQQQTNGGPVVNFVVRGGREAAWRVIDATRLLSITANLGDTRTTITHPATTTHGRLTPEVRAAAGVEEGLLRIAVGLENITDIQHDLARGLQ